MTTKRKVNRHAHAHSLTIVWMWLTTITKGICWEITKTISSYTISPKSYFLFQLLEHGFPSKPSALAYDPKLKLVAVGTKSGAIRMYPFLRFLFEQSVDTGIIKKKGESSAMLKLSWEDMHVKWLKTICIRRAYFIF